MSRFAIILPAAGSGSRFNAAAAGADAGTAAGTDKLLRPIGGKSVLQRAVSLFAHRPEVGIILIVTSPDRFDVYRHHLALPGDKLHFTAGGRERWESVLLGLRYLATVSEKSSATATVTHVAVHDAARPLTPAAVIDEAFRVAAERGAALPCIAEPATLKRRGDAGFVTETVSRKNLFQAQTPQCFHFARLLAAYQHLAALDQLHDVTDDAQVFERGAPGDPVWITQGSPLNLKITTPEDLLLAQAIIVQQSNE